ncbi:NADH-quinone oxidoreductase subunit J [Sulfolobus acidocaldarius]|uniref:Conserved protein n=4 Tax=Sulfolobus acidocaldarius TaxID=2285 RepID=Q4J6F8_SULAC|nr:NADH-quinone oxidoreductase subunit J [Sulfolobus acidocaldarius]AAY81623.1 conserved protein [Sulfolobus acidocaldarius DSM 639]AGE72226.1 hypothetical protein SacN8_11410 [Sulfolobus acidocaldarius N8]AGE74543.1 hypothetical protein SacRon12I_11655 [Sulfolobus acidocaldarius Ron12/I]ALU29607.1 NADH dehydrogenase [Sulfolobus acidocaldarius]ALU32340.1 NADH dehydrogenase [Sulfolobus acidocaldarius]
MSLTSDFQLAFLLLFSVFAIASSLLIVRQKNVFYSAVALGLLGVSVAVIIALLNPIAYSFYSALHLILYVGSAIVFLSVSLVVFRGLEVKERRVAWASILGFITALVVFFAFILTFVENTPTPLQAQVFTLSTFANTLLSDYWFPILILVIALATTLIEALSLARGGK